MAQQEPRRQARVRARTCTIRDSISLFRSSDPTGDRQGFPNRPVLRNTEPTRAFGALITGPAFWSPPAPAHASGSNAVGGDPWDVLYHGVAPRLPSRFGTITVLVGGRPSAAVDTSSPDAGTRRRGERRCGPDSRSRNPSW